MAQDYYYPKAGGDYRWHIQQKCLLAIGREPVAMMDTSDNQTMLRFDPPLDTGEETLISDIFIDPGEVCNAPTVAVANNKYHIKDIYEWRDELATNIGFPVQLWFVKSAPEKEVPDMIELQFAGRILTTQDKKAVTDAINELFIGWV